MSKKGVAFFYKALSPENRHFAYTPPEACELAKGTLYQSWFDALKLSPWYKKIAETGDFPSEKAKEAWENFGDLRNISFEDWWLKTGYEIYSERVPYRQLQVAIDYPEDQEKPPVLKIEVPLNLSPQMLQDQFKKLLKAHEQYDKYDRWNYSTAKVHQFRESKLTFGVIKELLNYYEKYEQQGGQSQITLDQFAILMKINPKVKIESGDSPAQVNDKKIILANNASYFLQRAKNFMANATELHFPSDSPHIWVTGK